jgi:ribosome biogenesis protein BMS1
MINYRYLKNEILNLSRFISVMKFRPLIWKNSHPYVLCDRFEDLTSPELIRTDPKCDRSISVYGYLRGTNLKPSSKVHLPGIGDLQISSINILPDPCPLTVSSRKKLNEKQKLIFAPMSDVGGILYDQDAIYINVPGNFTANNNEQTGDGERIVMKLQDCKETIGDKVFQSEMRLFNKSELLQAKDYQEIGNNNFDSDEEVTGGELDEEDDVSDNGSDLSDYVSDVETEVVDSTGRNRRKVASGIMKGYLEPEDDIEYAESDSDLGFSEDECSNADDYDEETELDGNDKANKLDVGFKNIFEKRRRQSMYDFIYKSTLLSYDGAESESEDDIEVEDSSIFTMRKQKTTKSLLYVDSCKIEILDSDIKAWDDEEEMESIRSRFITGKDVDETGQEVNDENLNDFEDLEDLEIKANDSGKDQGILLRHDVAILDFTAEREKNAKRKEELKAKFDQKYGFLVLIFKMARVRTVKKSRHFMNLKRMKWSDKSRSTDLNLLTKIRKLGH